MNYEFLTRKRPVLVIMQNMWVRDPQKIHDMIERHPEATREHYRRWLVAKLLFMGCKTGRVLTQVFGDRTNDWTFDESSREIASDPKRIYPADLPHLRTVYAELSPKVVIGFGKIATNALLECGIEHIAAPHPAARQSNMIELLGLVRDELDRRLQEMPSIN